MAENSDATLPFASEIWIMGSCFQRQLGLLVLICTTSCVFKVHMCKFSIQKSGRPKPNQPDRLLQLCYYSSYVCLCVHRCVYVCVYVLVCTCASCVCICVCICMWKLKMDFSLPVLYIEEQVCMNNQRTKKWRFTDAISCTEHSQMAGLLQEISLWTDMRKNYGLPQN